MSDKLSNLFLFYGENSFSLNEKLSLWKNEFIKKYGEEAQPEVIDGSKLDPAEFLTNLESLPFLVDKKMVIIKNFLSEGKTEKQKRVAEKLSKVPDFTVLIFAEEESPDKRTSLFKLLSQKGNAMEFKALSKNELIKWILSKAKESELGIDTLTANQLMNYCGENLWKLSSEIKKLKQYCAEKKPDQKDIETVCIPSISASIFKLTDAIAAKQSHQSLSTLKDLQESGEELSRIFYMIVRHFRILLQVKEMADKRENPASIARKLKQHPFTIQNSYRQVQNFDLQQLREIYADLLKIEIGIKTGKIRFSSKNQKEFELEVEKFILNLASQKPTRA